MNIQPVRPENVAEAAKAKPNTMNAKPQPQSKDVPSDSLTTQQNQSLLEALRSQPDVRPEMVEKGRALAADPNYPSADVLGAVARLFVNNSGR